MPSYHHHHQHRVALVGANPVLFFFFSSNSNFLSNHSSVLGGGSQYTWPPITGAGSRCQNMRSGHVSENKGCWALDDTWLSTERMVVATRQGSKENVKNIQCHGLRGRVNFEFDMPARRPYHLFV